MTDNENAYASEEFVIEDYKPPSPPKKSDYDNKTYFCDCCQVRRTITNDEEQRAWVEVQSSSFDSKVHLDAHLKTDKHKKNVALINALNGKLEWKVECKHCVNSFSAEGYKVHKNRNKMFWLLTDKSNFKSCNNIVCNGKRFASFNCLRKYKDEYETYTWRKKTYNKYLRLMREGKGQKRVHESVQSAIKNHMKSLNLEKYNN